jgi:hypothetical protein
MFPSRAAPAARKDFRKWLQEWQFTRFITLTFNDSMVGDAPAAGSSQKGGFVYARLKMWDARVNAKLLGKHWAKMAPDRTFAFFVLEKSASNPHWHGLVRFYTEDPAELLRQEGLFDQHAGRIWRRLVKSGTSDIQIVTDQAGATKYITKSFGNDVDYWNFIVPDQMQGG